jgi:hypothetical protein
MRLGVALITAGIGLGVCATAAYAGPCSNEILALEVMIGPIDGTVGQTSPSSPGAPGKRSAAPSGSRFEEALARAKKLDAEGNVDCWKPVAEIKMLIGM